MGSIQIRECVIKEVEVVVEVEALQSGFTIKVSKRLYTGSNDRMRVLSWNVQGAVPPMGSKDRIRSQCDFIESVADLPEIVMLNEVTTVQRDLWHDLLQHLGYTEIVDTLDWAAELRESEIPPHQEFGHVNGNLAAVHEECDGGELTRLSPSIRNGPWEDSELKDWDTNFPEKILNAIVQVQGLSVELWNIRTVPGSMYGEEKIKILENTYHRIKKGGQTPCILAGDLNSPDEELDDGTVIPWRYQEEGPLAERWVEAELNILRGLEDQGMVDVFRELNGYGDLDVADVSFQSKRFDHIISTSRKVVV